MSHLLLQRASQAILSSPSFYAWRDWGLKTFVTVPDTDYLYPPPALGLLQTQPLAGPEWDRMASTTVKIPMFPMGTRHGKPQKTSVGCWASERQSWTPQPGN